MEDKDRIVLWHNNEIEVTGLIPISDGKTQRRERRKQELRKRKGRIK